MPEKNKFKKALHKSKPYIIGVIRGLAVFVVFYLLIAFIMNKTNIDFDMSIMSVLLSIKADIDQKVYDKNNILKKDAYFEQTVMTQIKEGMDKLGIANKREDRKFIQSRITRQYLNQYNATYAVA